MKEVKKLCLGEGMGHVFVSDKTINGQPLEFGNELHSKVVRRLETHSGRAIKIPEQSDVTRDGITILSADPFFVRYKGSSGRERSVKKQYFINTYC